MEKIKYKKHEFCKAVNCDAIIAIIDYSCVTSSCGAYVCIKTARHFHEWLDDNGFGIVKIVESHSD